MGKSYRYLKHGKYLVCLDQSILDVIRFVVLGYERNKLGSIGISKSIARAAVRAVVKDRLRLLGSRTLTELPTFGHVGITVHRGCKLFDFSRNHVTKVFGSDANAEDARLEIRASKHASDIEAAPRFIVEDPGRAWYREEYVRGVHATDAEVRTGADILDYYPAIENCLLDLVACKPPKYVDTMEHIKQKADVSFREQWIDAGQDTDRVQEIAEYVTQLNDWLRNQQKPDRLQLVLTHGDFSLVNAIVTDDGLRFIDWEGVTSGGLFSDVFHFLFAERYYKRIADSFLVEVSEYTDRYRNACLGRFPELREATKLDQTIARRLYYLERLSLMLKRSVSTNLCDVVCNSIATFNAYDQDAGDVAV